MQAEHFDPVPGACEHVSSGLRRVLAPNPSPMTFRGTNTYLLGTGAVAVIDPGPMSDRHLTAILQALEPGEIISHILVTHSHIDHSPLASRLSALTGALIYGYGPSGAGRSAVMTRLAAAEGTGGGEGIDATFTPDIRLANGAIVEGADWRIEAIHTPGHLGNHLCFAWDDACFTGDHVMGWASSLVSPPDGDMGAYMASLDRLANRHWRVFHPGHGAPITDPAQRLAFLTAHRRGREAEILAALDSIGTDIPALTRRIYSDVSPSLLPAAERNVFAHLVDLLERNLVTQYGLPGFAANFARVSAPPEDV